MSVLNINKSEYGIIGIESDVLIRDIVKSMLEMKELLMPCHKRGKMFKNYNPDVYSDSYGAAVSITESHGKTEVTVYAIISFGESISAISGMLADRIEEVFAIYKMNKPAVITVNIRGVMAKQIAERNIEVVRHNG